MKYKIKTENTFGKNLVDIVLENRDLTRKDMENLLNPNVENIESSFKIPNMDKAIKLFISELDKESIIGIVPDVDVDGQTSSALLQLFLMNECQVPRDRIRVFYHEGKEHGLIDEKLYKEIKKSDVDFLIVADAGTNDTKEIKELLKMGKRVLVIDHHNVNSKDQDGNSIDLDTFKTSYKDQNGEIVGVILNNQLGDYSKSLSGVGVVYKFLVAMTEDELVHYMDLVAIGNVADVMNLNDLELRYIVNKGLSNINNEFIKEILGDNFSESEFITPTDVSFNIANKINAVCRYGSMEEKIDTFRALAGEEEYREYKPRKSKNNPNPQVENQTLQKFMARVIGNVKTRQDKAVKDSMKKIQSYIEENKCDENKVIIIVNEEKGKNSLIKQNIGGLVANKLIDIYKKPIMIIHKRDKTYEGSMRGYGVESFSKVLESTGIVETMGHDNSAGVKILKKDMPRLQKRIEEAMSKVEVKVQEQGHEVDCEIDINNISKKDIETICEMKKIWYSGCGEPKFIIKNLKLDEKDILQPFATLITFKYNDYKFDKNFASGEFVNRILHKDEKRFGRATFDTDVIVKLSKNEYNKNGFFEVVDMETRISEEKSNKKEKGCPF